MKAKLICLRKSLIANMMRWHKYAGLQSFSPEELKIMDNINRIYSKDSRFVSAQMRRISSVSNYIYRYKNPKL